MTKTGLRYDILDLSHDIAKRFNNYKCLNIAASLSFTTVLALVPLLTVIFSAFSLFPVFETWSEKIEHFVFSNFVPTAGEQVREHLNSFAANAGRLTALGLLTLFISSILLLYTIENAFNEIWGIKQGRKLFQRLIAYWAVLTLSPLLIATSLSMSSALLSTSILRDQTLIAGVTAFVLKYIPLILETITFILFYKAIPNTDVKIRHAFIGGVIAMVLFELAKLGFGLFILKFNNYQLVYGALATIPIFLLWVYLSWAVLLIGAVIVAELGYNAKDKAQKKQPIKTPPVNAIDPQL